MAVCFHEDSGHPHPPPEQQHLLLRRDSDHNPMKRCPTPLPVFQLSILLYMRFCDASANFVIEPFINELLLSFADGDEATVAYLASIMDMCLYAAALTTVLYWTRLSDSVGRKPVIILGAFALTISTLLIGMSTAFWALVISRCIASAFHQSAVTRCAVGEMTDESNSADAFAILNLPWTLGMLAGSLIGGYLSNPYTRFPELFSEGLWQRLPYLLPCATVAIIVTPGLLILCIRFRETLPRRVISRDGGSSGVGSPRPAPIRSLLIPRVILAISSDSGFAFLHAAYVSIYPLFLAMSPSVGGLGLLPSQIGLIFAARGIFGSVAQALLIGPAVRKFSLRSVFTTAVMALIPTFLFFPLMNLFANDSAVDGPASRGIMWALLTLQFVFITTAEAGYTCMYMYIIAAAPNKHTWGAVNGLAQISYIGARLTGSVFATFMLGVSIERGWMGGYAVYVLMCIFTYGMVVLARKLPRDVSEWPGRD